MRNALLAYVNFFVFRSATFNTVFTVPILMMFSLTQSCS